MKETISLKKSCEDFTTEVRELFSRLERRSEVLMAISRAQQARGFYEVAEGYKHQAMQLKKDVERIRKLMSSKTEDE
jgi:hypothetical protein